MAKQKIFSATSIKLFWGLVTADGERRNKIFNIFTERIKTNVKFTAQGLKLY